MGINGTHNHQDRALGRILLKVKFIEVIDLEVADAFLNAQNGILQGTSLVNPVAETVSSHGVRFIPHRL